MNAGIQLYRLLLIKETNSSNSIGAWESKDEIIHKFLNPLKKKLLIEKTVSESNLGPFHKRNLLQYSLQMLFETINNTDSSDS